MGVLEGKEGEMEEAEADKVLAAVAAVRANAWADAARKFGMGGTGVLV